VKTVVLFISKEAKETGNKRAGRILFGWGDAARRIKSRSPVAARPARLTSSLSPTLIRFSSDREQMS